MPPPGAGLLFPPPPGSLLPVTPFERCLANCIDEWRFNLSAVLGTLIGDLGLGTMPKTQPELDQPGFGPKCKRSPYTGQPSRWASRTGLRALRRFGESRAGILLGAIGTGAVVAEGFYDWGVIASCTAICALDTVAY